MKPRIVDANGSYVVGQMYVKEYKLASPRYPYPVLLWHGGGMSGTQWEATPDGREGWLWHLLSAGFDVIVSDAVERGRSPWRLEPEATGDSLPIYRSKEEAWNLFRIGELGNYSDKAGERIAFPGQQFPVEAFDAFCKQFVPRWLNHGEMERTGYEALLDHVGECVIIGHSQGGGYALRMAQAHPRSVRAVVALEPTGMPQGQITSRAPHMMVWADHFSASAQWRRYRDDAHSYCDRLKDVAPVTVLDLPQEGIQGNSHFMMMDRNSEEVAGLVCEWLLQCSSDFQM